MRSPPPRRLLLVVCLVGATIAVACGIGIRRDYSATPVGRIGFDDMCGLQDYFDTIEGKLATAPALASAVDMESQSDQRVQGGKNRFAFETDFQLKHLRRVLNENWSRLPETLAAAQRIDIEVHWSQKAGVRRVVTDSDAELIVGRESYPLPYHVCLSELLFGEPLYRQRREMSGRPLPFRSIFADGGLGPDPVDANPAATPTAAPPAPAVTAPAPAPVAPPPPAPTTRDAGVAPPARPVFKPAPPAQ